MRLVLYQPDIPQNAGAMMRLAACLALPLELIEPCGFVLSDRRLRRAGMDYLDHLQLTRHASYAAFAAWRQSQVPGARLLLLTTRGERSHLEFGFHPDDLLMVGRETAGVPEEVHAGASARLRIPIAPGRRSLNVALAAAMVLGEALRQTGLFPGNGG
ncbi:MAG TPA: tRNA (cytidine(34)-2'-O)-methyltransferase [Candidatus Sulfotelmatobacter sp.]|nr:tRNA (cytidine(34)-2'-O)-methyltransferase [Candidatus Sulfotelmatobacter sp.]HUI16655.1 tRNA (cytidine(34)-2'-O)-methyltransferase [Alphaproteobacteria bacterium]